MQNHILRHPRERDEVRDKVRDEVRDEVWDEVRDEVRDKVRDPRIYSLMKEDVEIIPGNILSYHEGS